MKNIRFLFHLLLTLLLVTGCSIKAMQQDHVINIPLSVTNVDAKVEQEPRPFHALTREEKQQKNALINQQMLFDRLNQAQAQKALEAASMQQQNQIRQRHIAATPDRHTKSEHDVSQVLPSAARPTNSFAQETPQLAQASSGAKATTDRLADRPQFEQKRSHLLISTRNDGPDSAYPGLPPLPNLVNSVGARPRQATTDRQAQQQHASYPADQYAQAPNYEQLLQEVRDKHDAHDDAAPGAAAPSQHFSSLIATKTSGKVNNYETLLAIVTTVPALQKLIRDYAFPYDKLIKQRAEINCFNINTASSPDTLHSMTITETSHENDDSYFIATSHASKYSTPYARSINLHTIEGKHQSLSYKMNQDQEKRNSLAEPSYQVMRAIGYALLLCITSKACGAQIFTTMHPGIACLLSVPCGCSVVYGDLQKTFPPEEIPLSSMAFHPNGTIITGSYSFLQASDQEGKLQNQIHVNGSRWLQSIAVHTDGTIITGSADGTAKVWKNYNEAPPILPHGSPITFVAINAHKIVTVSDQIIKLWAHDGKEIKAISHAPFRITAIKLCTNGTIVFALIKYTAAAPHARCDLVSHYNPITDQTIKKLELSADVFDVSAIEELSDGSIIVGTLTGHLIRWNADKSPTPLRRRDSAVISMSVLKNGAIAVGFKDNVVEFLMLNTAAEKLLDKCSLEQLAFVKQLIDRAKEHPNEPIVLHENTRDRELFLSLPAYIRGALRSHCPKLQLPTDIQLPTDKSSAPSLCCKKNQ